MTLPRRLVQTASALQCWLLARAPAGVWLVAAVIAVAFVWGAIDPLRLRQRLDGMITDQFLRFRTPPPVHPDLLLVAIDDRTSAEIDFPVPRYALGQVLRQLRKLEVRTVLVDVLFTEPRREPAPSAGAEWLVPAGSVLTGEDMRQRFRELRERFTADHVLMRGVAGMERIVIPFQFQSSDPSVLARRRSRAGDDELLHQMAAALGAEPRLDPTELAERLKAEPGRVGPLFSRAVQAAMERFAREALEQDPAADATATLDRLFPGEPDESYLAVGFRRAFNEIGTELAIARKASVPALARPELHPLIVGNELTGPRHLLAAAVDTLGFADAQSDADGTHRALPLVARWRDRFVFHQGLLAALRHRDVRPTTLRVESDGLWAGDAEHIVTLTPRGTLPINWPMNRRREWSEAIPQISLADIYALARYEDDVTLSKHNRREYHAGLDKYSEPGGSWQEHFDKILTAYRRGEPDRAAELERLFDEKAVPEIRARPDVVAAFETARTTSPPPPTEPPDRPLVQYARFIRDFDEQIPLQEAAYNAQFQQLLPDLRGKLCLVGDTTTGSSDLKQTPVDGAMPGIAVIAAAVNTVLSARYLQPTGYATSATLMAVLVAMLSSVFLQFSAVRAGLSGLAAVLVALFGSFALLQSADVLVSPVTPVAGLVASYFTSTTYRWRREYLQKQIVRRLFEHFLDPTVVEQVCQNPDLLKLDGDEKELTILFSDIRGFSTISEGLDVKTLVRWLNHYLTAMTEIVFRDGGCLDKYIGDAVMAFYGAPAALPDPAFQACHTALSMMARIQELRARWQEMGFPAFDIGIGINSGSARVGHMGSEQHFDYTVMGDEVNLASRLEGVNKEYGTNIILSESTWERVRDRVATRELDVIQVKGKKKPTRIFEAIGLAPLPADQLEPLRLFEQALHAYRSREWQDAARLLNDVLARKPGDAPSRVYLERCEEFLHAPPPPDWNGVYTMKTK